MTTCPEIDAALSRHAAERPHAAAVIGAAGTLTYRDLDLRVDRVVASLAGAGLRPGDLLAIALPDGPHAVAALLAAVRAGLPFTWLDTDQPAHRHRLLLDDCRPRAVLTADGVHLRPGARDGLPSGAACVVYTSGSTGVPKGIVQFGANLHQLAAWFAAEIGIGPDDRALQWAKFSYDAASLEVFAAVLTGAALVVPPPAAKSDVGTIARWIATQRVTLVQAVPSLCRALLHARDALGEPPLPHVRVLSLFGEILHGHLVARARTHFPDATLYNLYGPTECGLATFLRVPDGADGAVPVGHPIPGREILLRAATGEPPSAGMPVSEGVPVSEAAPVPDGDIGEIWVRSPHLAHGYLDRPDETSRVFLPGGDGGHRVYRTGDLGRRRPDGTLEFHGRGDDQVKIRGIRVELGEIDAALYADPGVAQAGVAVHGTGTADARLTAYLEPHPGAPVDIAALHRGLTRTLPAALVPAAYVLLDQLPRTSTGKIDRTALPDPEPRGGADAPHRPPETPTQRALAEIWTSVLGCGRVGLDDDYFALGGTSLLAPRLVDAVHEELGVELPVRAVFEHPRLGHLADLIDREYAREREEHAASEA
ncbi:non-ribosomal peptide synthetase [Actinomadura gamaensis]|uniref:AMP-binding protein n=1 Tax=Actinomadura gamaensis TaxID=1763541 RepID=A0ABV9TZ22_9ACTN